MKALCLVITLIGIISTNAKGGEASDLNRCFLERKVVAYNYVASDPGQDCDDETDCARNQWMYGAAEHQLIENCKANMKANGYDKVECHYIRSGRTSSDGNLTYYAEGTGIGLVTPDSVTRSDPKKYLEWRCNRIAGCMLEGNVDDSLRKSYQEVCKVN